MTTTLHTHSDRASYFFESYRNITVRDMFDVQQVFIDAYRRGIEEGRYNYAERLMDLMIIPLGEAIDMRDGTCRECAEARNV